jgi:hypothetical protein
MKRDRAFADAALVVPDGVTAYDSHILLPISILLTCCSLSVPMSRSRPSRANGAARYPNRLANPALWRSVFARSRFAISTLTAPADRAALADAGALIRNPVLDTGSPARAGQTQSRRCNIWRLLYSQAYP